MELKTYSEVIRYLDKEKRQRHLLLGNGISMAYDAGIFSYNALNKFIEEIDNELLRKLFQIVNTKNFEVVMQQLDNFCQLAEEFSSDKGLTSKIQIAGDSLKSRLIDAVKQSHPDHVFEIPEEKSKSCARFLNPFLESDRHVFTTNYDLLLYWVLMRNEIENAIDGFGRDAEETDEWVEPDDRDYSELRWGKYKGIQTVRVNFVRNVFLSHFMLVFSVYCNQILNR